jgi:hypothetical protein
MNPLVSASPVVPSVHTWQEVPFRRPLVGWRELAAHMGSRSHEAQPTADCLRVAFWAGRIPVRAVRYGQKIVFDRTSADAFLRSREDPKAGKQKPRR